MEGGRVPPILSLDASLSWGSMEIRIQERVGLNKQQEASPQIPLSPATAKLSREDMSIYGSLPSHDPMQLVVCTWCGRTVKDTAMLRHQELHHPSTKDSPILLNKVTHPHSNKSILVKEQKAERKKKGKGKDHYYDPDRHCGVWIVDEKRNCLRSLTCKYHSLSLRRQVKDRSKPFDELLMLHREQKRGKSLNQVVSSKPTVLAQATTSPSDDVQISTLLDSTTIPSHQLPSVAFAEMWVNDLDDEGKESAGHSSVSGTLPHSSVHPKPLACCKWRARTAGGGHLLFNRRQDQLFSSLQKLAANTESSTTNSTTVVHRKHVFSLLHNELELRKSIVSNNHLQRNNFHIPLGKNKVEVMIGATPIRHNASSLSATKSSSSNNTDFQFLPPKTVRMWSQSEERTNSMLTTSTKISKHPKKRRRSSVEQSSPVVDNSSRSSDVSVSPLPVDGLRDVSQPFVSLTDIGYLAAVPTTINTLQPMNHQVHDVKNRLISNTFNNEQQTIQQHYKDTITSPENNLNSIISKMVQQQSPSLPLPQQFMFNGILAGPSGSGGLLAMSSPPVGGTASGNLLSFHPNTPTAVSPHIMPQFNNPAVSSHQLMPGGISPLPHHEAQEGDKSSNAFTLHQYLQERIASGQMVNLTPPNPYFLPKQPASYHQHNFAVHGPRTNTSNANCNCNADETTCASFEPILQFASSYSSDDKQSELSSLFDSKRIDNADAISDHQQVT